MNPFRHNPLEEYRDTDPKEITCGAVLDEVPLCIGNSKYLLVCGHRPNHEEDHGHVYWRKVER